MSNFEKASRLKLRYKTNRGSITTEDLWDLELEDLDTIAKSLNKQLKESNEESFIRTRTKKSSSLEIQFEVVKHIINVKLDEEEARKNAAVKRQQKAKLLDLIAQKENENLSAKSIGELTAELEKLDSDE